MGKGKRKAGLLIAEDLLREVRRGGRTTLYVDLDVPEAPGHRVIIASTHLQNRAKPKIRGQQMAELLNQVRDTANPVTIAGDSTPTSVETCCISVMAAWIFGLRKVSSGPPEWG